MQPDATPFPATSPSSPPLERRQRRPDAPPSGLLELLKASRSAISISPVGEASLEAARRALDEVIIAIEGSP